jgi:hypothetical protein
MEAWQKLRAKVTGPTKDPLALPGEPDVSFRPSFSQLLRRSLEPSKTGLNLKKTMEVKQKDGTAKTNNAMRMAERIANDIDIGNAASSQVMGTINSNTFKNLSVANVLGRALGSGPARRMQQSPGWRTVMKPFSWLHTQTDEAIQTLLVDAWLNPQVAAMLMEQASAKNIAAIGPILQRRALTMAQGAAIYGGDTPSVPRFDFPVGPDGTIISEEE